MGCISVVIFLARFYDFLEWVGEFLVLRLVGFFLRLQCYKYKYKSSRVTSFDTGSLRLTRKEWNEEQKPPCRIGKRVNP